ncbi:toll/interleukin-1 receptor domain-containing protein, partial [Chloroflexi bacterium CFX5]|nr:toll/interleukin-1 receptor domain-containing protein [Chloroflexi bacterium CFX5]
MFKHKVFISYAREDSEIAKKLYDDLSQAGVELWFDRESLAPGQDWQLEIEKAIKESTFFLALISSKSTTKRGFA